MLSMPQLIRFDVESQGVSGANPNEVALGRACLSVASMLIQV